MIPVFQDIALLREIFFDMERKELRSVALTCCAFRKPAQDFLWKHLDCGILPLFKLISNLQFREEHDPPPAWKPIKTYYLNDTISPSDLEQLKLFGARVRVLSFSRRMPPQIVDSYVITEVLCVLQGQLLFPNLEDAYWDIVPRDSPALLPLLYSPRLKNLHINSEWSKIDTSWSYSTRAFVHRLAKDSLGLTELCVGLPSPQSFLDHIPSSFSQVCLLEIQGDSTAAFNLPYMVSLSKLSHLSGLYLEVHSFHLNQDDASNKLSFGNLNYLSIKCPFDDFILFVSQSTFPSLTELDHAFVIPPHPETVNFQWSQMLAAIRGATTASFNELGIILWKQIWSDNPYHFPRFMREYQGVSFESLANSLFQLNLIRLTFAFPLFKSLSIENFTAIARAWPKIRSLQLHCTTKETIDTGALTNISNCLLELTDLSVDIVSQPSWTYVFVPVHSFHGLQNLSVRLLDWSETLFCVGSFVAFVDTTFPCLLKIEQLDFTTTSTPELDEDKKSRPSELTECLNLFQSACVIERERHEKDEIADMERLGEGDDQTYTLWIRHVKKREAVEATWLD